MKVITLNTWGGRAGKEALLRFFEANKDTDVFCLQEVWAAPYDNLDGRDAGGRVLKQSDILIYGVREISEVLKDHVAYFRPHYSDSYGLMMLVKRGIDVLGEGEVFVHREKGFVPEGDVGLHARNVQYVTLATARGEVSILNFHGLWNGKGKGDSDDRIEQSERLIRFMKTLSSPYIICGDFNLLPDTKSLGMFEEFGLLNLIKEHGITSTRTRFYDKDVKFADYTLVGPGLAVEEFKILPDEVSDHAPMYVAFDREA